MAMQHVRPGEVYDLAPSSANPGNGFTVAIVKTKMFEAVRLVIRSGTSIKEHKFDGPITLHCLEGRVLLGLSESSRELSDGHWLYLDGGTPHSISGIQDATLLLTILFPHQDRTVAGQSPPHKTAIRRLWRRDCADRTPGARWKKLENSGKWRVR